MREIIKKILLLLSLSLVSACHSYNDVKLKVLNSETNEAMGDTYIIVNDLWMMIPTPFRTQKLYKTDSNGELIIDRDGNFLMTAIKGGYAISRKWANTYKNSDPTKDGFVPKTILMQKSDKELSVSLKDYTIKDYDCEPLAKEFIDYCIANKIKIYRGNSGYLFKLEDDK